MCYTSGTTGDPKGVVYSHRSTYLHSMAGMTTNCVGARRRDRVLVIVPMFHANAWGIPYTSFMAGTDLVMPERFLQAEPLARMFVEHRPTMSLGVPTIWNDLLRYAETHPGRSLVGPDAHSRWIGGPEVADGGLRQEVRSHDRPGLGNDRDEPSWPRSPGRPRACRRKRRSNGGPSRVGSYPA